MKAIAATALLVTAFPIFFLNSRASDNESQDTFFSDRETALRQEYLECTGDEQPVELQFVIGWKKRMDAWKETPQYAQLFAEYRRAFPGVKSVGPCVLIEWNKRRKLAQDSAEKILLQRILSDNEANDVAEELKKNAPSRFDFAAIPFGVSKRAFKYLFKKKCTLPLLEQERFLYTEEAPWNGVSFLTAFFFNDDNVLYKYEAESDALPAQYLNGAVRTAAAGMERALEHCLGPASRCNRIGLYDIKSGELTIRNTWSDSSHSAAVGFSVLDYQYYAKAVVINTKLSPKAPSVAAKYPFPR